ncbi:MULTISPECIES: NOG1 family protein [Halorubrum]|uniref:GTP-binding protein n=1 Tax=Halorubrum persicum TaxID=1383844 RepID=A0A2G1WLB3_9EURY|nr:NOG1 family protein [Halorubrum persicum]PHQ39767.1 GTP-binding protein [Halorubrum persicum]
MIFEGLPTTPRSEELVDKAFSRAARAGRAKHGHEAQESMLRTAGNVLSDNLENVVVSWPDFGFDVEPFYYELADAIVDVDRLRQALSQVMWASRQIEDLRDEYTTKIRNSDVDTARKHRKQAFARMADVMDQIEDDLRYIGDSRDQLKVLPDVKPDEPAIVVAGYPNVGKSSFVNRVTRASNQIAEYPFTTKGVQIGHFERDHIRYQIVDTPGLLDRPADERNDIERQAVSALEHLADVVVFVLDPSGDCGYPLGVQLELREEVRELFGEAVPFLTVANKHDRFDAVQAESVDATMSVTKDENVERVLDMAVEAAAFEPDLPTRDGEE